MKMNDLDHRAQDPGRLIPGLTTSCRPRPVHRPQELPAAARSIRRVAPVQRSVLGWTALKLASAGRLRSCRIECSA